MADNYGKISSYAEIVVIFFQPILGFLFDTIGRKIPLICGMLIISVAVGCIPLSHELYPWFLIYRCMLSVGTVVGLNLPLLPDYVAKEHLGKAQGVVQVIISFAFIFSSTGLLEVA